MPYVVDYVGKGKYAVRKKGGGKVLGTHPSMAKAMRQVRAIYANERKRIWMRDNYRRGK